MKFKTNFVASSVNSIKLVGNVLQMMSVFLVVYIIYLVYQGMIQQEETFFLNEKQAKLQKHMEQQQTQVHQSISNDQLQKLKLNIDTLNQASNSKGLDMSSVLYAIETTLPEGVLIEQFDYDAENSESSLMVKSKEPDLLNEFMAKLQQNILFDRINLISQKQLTVKKSVIFQYQITVQHKI